MELCFIQKLVGGMPISTTTLSIMAKLRQLILNSTYFKQINIFMTTFHSDSGHARPRLRLRFWISRPCSENW